MLVAKLNGDATDTLGSQIFEVLKEFSGVQALPLDRTLASDGRMTEAMEAEAGEAARGYLQRSGASVLIWGSVLDREHKIAKLFLTTSSAAPQKGGQYQPEIGTAIRLPDVFWSDLAQILRLAIASRDAEFRAKEGHYVADRLPPFIASVRHLLNESRDRPGWDTDARGSTLVIVADVLQTLGDQSGQNAPLQEAVTPIAMRSRNGRASGFRCSGPRPRTTSATRLRRLASGRAGTARLEEAVAAYRNALKEWTERVTLDWAATQNNLGNALTTLGERESGKARLEEAVDAYRDALAVFVSASADHYAQEWSRQPRQSAYPA